jgi:hypothetical protein
MPGGNGQGAVPGGAGSGAGGVGQPGGGSGPTRHQAMSPTGGPTWRLGHGCGTGGTRPGGHAKSAWEAIGVRIGHGCGTRPGGHVKSAWEAIGVTIRHGMTAGGAGKSFSPGTGRMTG